MNDRRSPYKSYRQALSTALDPSSLQRWRLIILAGDNDYLLSSTRVMLKDGWEKAGWKVDRIDGPKLSLERFYNAVSTRSLFDPQSVNLVIDAQQAPELLASLETLKDAKDIKNPLVILWKGKELAAKIAKETQRLTALQIPCHDPAPWELKDFVVDLSKRHGLSFSSDAVELVLEAIGGDLSRIENEMRRLALTLKSSSGPTHAAALRPHLGFLREDHIFKLDQWLCAGATSKALLLLKDLLDRGEKPLGLLAILAMHCRKAIQIQSGLKNGNSQQELARTLRLPPSVIQTYVPYVQKKSAQHFQKALQLCHEADRRLKSRGEGEELWLGQILFALRG